MSICFSSVVFVFKPAEPRPLYIQKNISREEVQWGVFVPRDVPESFTSEAYQWLNRSQFYFLTKSQVIAPSEKGNYLIYGILEK
jgi:NET1-associated nuclear protein 1 (U3 small nucleolar RNA-associated protein 17)